MKSLAFLLTSAALPPGSLCMRLQELAPDAPGSSGAHGSSATSEYPGRNGSFTAPLGDSSVVPVDEFRVELEGSFDTKVPPIDTYRNVWTRRFRLESHLSEPLPSSIKMILGVFTVARDAEYRQVVRQTWLQQAGVCYWTQVPKHNCSVYTAFVIGKYGPQWNVTAEEVERAYLEEGMLVLDTPENMNRGKSGFWFRTALGMFPWATHIAKMDMDTYPFVHKLLTRMESNRSCVNPYEFIGRPHNSYGANFTEYCPYEQCQGQFMSWADRTTPHGPVAALNGNWRFLSGEFYILSMPLVQMLPWAKQKGGTEDLFLSRQVNQAAKDNHFCVTLRRLDAWFHRNSLVDADYSNNF